MILDFDKLMYPCFKNPHAYDLERIRKAYRDAFLSDNGKVVLADIAQRGLIHTVSFTGETPLSTAFNEGKRALALEIIYLLNPNPARNKKGGPYDGTTEFDARAFD